MCRIAFILLVTVGLTGAYRYLDPTGQQACFLCFKHGNVIPMIFLIREKEHEDSVQPYDCQTVQKTLARDADWTGSWACNHEMCKMPIVDFSSHPSVLDCKAQTIGLPYVYFLLRKPMPTKYSPFDDPNDDYNEVPNDPFFDHDMYDDIVPTEAPLLGSEEMEYMETKTSEYLISYAIQLLNYLLP